MWDTFIERVDADSVALDERTKHHRQLLDDNLRWQRKAEEVAGHHEQWIENLERNLEEKEVYINNLECAVVTLSSRIDAMEDKVCRCNEVQVEEEVMEEDDPTSELSYKSQYSLGAKGNIPSGYIVSSLWVLKQFAHTGDKYRFTDQVNVD